MFRKTDNKILKEAIVLFENNKPLKAISLLKWNLHNIYYKSVDKIIDSMINIEDTENYIKHIEYCNRLINHNNICLKRDI